MVHIWCEPEVEIVGIVYPEGPGGVPHKELSPAYRTPPPVPDWFTVARADPAESGLPDEVLAECEGE